MRVPVSWLRVYAAVPSSETGRDIAHRLIAAGLEVETVDVIGGDVKGPLVVGRVLGIEELVGHRKPIRFCRVEVGAAHGHPDTPGVRDVICGASNFAVGDLVAVALPGSVLAGGFEIESRKTYGHVSDGMICSAAEVGLAGDPAGIMVLPSDAGTPGDDAAPLLGLGEEVLDIAVTPDRGYALSIRGVAREAAIAYDVPFEDPGTVLSELPVPAEGEPHPCGTKDPTGCDLFTLRTIKGFDPSVPTPLWMLRRLEACGMRSVSLAVDVTNYVMLETGQPLHAFDLDSLRGPVRARRAHLGEKLETLDHVERLLDPDDIVIADDRGAVGLAGTMGGLDAEITRESTNLALEAAHFSPRGVARMSRRHKLSSEASRRFERGVDTTLAPYASAKATALMLELSGGTYLGMTGVETGHEEVRIEMAAGLPAEVAGTPIDGSVAADLLGRVGCEVAVTGNTLVVTPPPWRPDLTDPYDLVEEVVRLVGYEHVPSVLPAVPAQRGWTRDQRLRRRAGIALAGAGYVEVPAYPFMGQADFDVLRLPPDDLRRRAVRLANPLSDEAPLLRTTLLNGLLACARRNLSRGSDDLALFEQGLVFLALDGPSAGSAGRPDVSARPSEAELDELDGVLPDQPRHFAVVLTGLRERAGWWGPGRTASWADAITAARVIAVAVGSEIDVAAGSDPMFHPGRCAALSTGGTVIGSAGELHPQVIAAAGLPARTCAMEMDFDALTSAAVAVVPAPVVGTMPVAKEDVALVVDADVPAAAVMAALASGAGPLLESVRLFDEYSGEQIGAGRRSLAFSLRFRAPDRTLTAAEVAEARNGAVAAAEVALGAVLRS
ncbi:MAG: phenylalanine--tRNA ligase subunit beta [Candidatus Nanopelagicales bacterium]|nr:phenylalanine--tRNA ligase subunit beta [Candidatus Nanopelagicales bacterium]MDZ4249660.1 phenylalanine--tRNA ligase subunit beta [Candidatus Nanopelagicales bacterium]